MNACVSVGVSVCVGECVSVYVCMCVHLMYQVLRRFTYHTRLAYVSYIVLYRLIILNCAGGNGLFFFGGGGREE